MEPCVPTKCLCELHDMYADSRGLDDHSLPAWVRKNKKQADKDIDELRKVMAGEDMSVPAEQLEDSFRVTWSFSESFPFITKTAFRDRWDIAPEDLKLSVVKVRDSRGEYVQGLLLEPDKLPRVKCKTEQILDATSVVLPRSEHRYADQVRATQTRLAEEKGRAHACEFAAKYVSKKRNPVHYTEEKLEQMVFKYREQQRLAAKDTPFLEQLAAEGRAMQSSGSGEELNMT